MPGFKSDVRLAGRLYEDGSAWHHLIAFAMLEDDGF
jgi:hypothetical protein